MAFNKTDRQLSQILAMQAGSNFGKRLISQVNPVRCPGCRARVYVLRECGVCLECEVSKSITPATAAGKRA